VKPEEKTIIKPEEKTIVKPEKMDVMSLAQYLEMWRRIQKWQTENNTTDLPNYVTVSDFNIEGLDKVEKTTFLDMLDRVKKWQETHDGKMPQIIGIKGAANGTEPIHTTNGSIQARLEAGLGKFNSFTEFWQKIIGRGYNYYYNSSYNLDQEISRLINKQGLNCTDSMELCYSLAKEMGYEVQYVHVMCKQGGHIRGQIKGHEFKNWTRIDPAAAISTSTRAGIGTVWCDYPNAHIEIENWLRR
jgi:hypothetical protein